MIIYPECVGPNSLPVQKNQAVLVNAKENLVLLTVKV